MKKLIFTAAIAIFGLSNAQTFGLKAGANVSSVSNSEDSKAKFGFYAGAFVNVPIAEIFSLQPEVLYNSKGVKYDGAGDGKLNLDYISVPVMFQYKATPQFYLEAGPEFSFAISAKEKWDGGSEDAKDFINGFDLGIGLGAGYNFTSSLGANVRYVAGVTDIIKDNDGSDSYRNGVFQFGLTYKFGK
ncbi:porin family protein [Epilithonimonas zeae]|uniref:Outer membrane protein beta-barrel domain-containing protein n=1 Tax=Epilithonimonas zeae TaxID=1416779 RepID=A0A1N6E0N2_9FLAO|nr:porin family protein [Epilithonimonas zeae]SIN76553.1 Outer membrane protein beta-barrel domain-containing protein [Epilithonimonas zeae]